jgi:hypothetical protein
MRVVWVKSSIKDKRRREKQTKNKEENLMKEIENQQKPNQPMVQPSSLPPIATIIASLLFETNSNVKTLAIFPFFFFFTLVFILFWFYIFLMALKCAITILHTHTCEKNSF